MKNKKFNTVEQFLNPIPKSINLAHKYMTAHFPKWGGGQGGTLSHLPPPFLPPPTGSLLENIKWKTNPDKNPFFCIFIIYDRLS